MNPSQQHTQRNSKVSNAIAHSTTSLSSSEASSFLPSSQPIQMALSTFADVEGSRDRGGGAHLPRTIETVKLITNADTASDGTEPAEGDGLGENRSGQVTRIRWGALNGNDGTLMNAQLGPDHRKGTEPGDKGKWVDQRKLLTEKSGGHKYIAGHLLNHELGGPGDLAQNLAAIPEEINKKHNTGIEEAVKTAVNTRGEWGNYSVDISHKNDDDGTLYASGLRAQWNPLGMSADGLIPAKGRNITLTLGIPAPSVFAAHKGEKFPVKDEPIIEQNDNGPDQLVTPFRFNELPLHSFTSKISSYGHLNAQLIQTLQQHQLTSHETLTKIKSQFLGQISDMHKRLEDLSNELGYQEVMHGDELEQKDRELAFAMHELGQQQEQLQDLRDELIRAQVERDRAEERARNAEQERDKAMSYARQMEEQNSAMSQELIRLRAQLQQQRPDQEMHDAHN